MQLRLNTLENCRNSYARILREYMTDQLDDQKARTAAYLLNGMLQYWRLEADLRIEQRISAIEERINAET